MSASPTNRSKTRAPLLRPLRRPRRWLALWLLLIALVIGASLLPAGRLPAPSFAGIDKLEHFLAYALLSAYAVMLFARMRAQAWTAAGLVVLGVGLEYAQALLTDSRLGDLRDAMANTLGVLAGLLTASTRLARLLQRLDARLP